MKTLDSFRFACVATVCFLLSVVYVQAQAPIISYTSPQVYTMGTAISPLTPTNTGGAISALGYVTTLAGSGNSAAYADGVGAAARFGQIQSLCTVGGYLYAADCNYMCVRRVDIASGTVTTFAGKAGVSGSTDGIGTAARFTNISGITTDGQGNLYVSDQGAHTIRKIVIATGVVSTFAGNGTQGVVNATGTAAGFNAPQDLCSDGTNLYVTEVGSHDVRKIVLATGVVTTLAGSGSAGFADATGASASFNSPRNICTDGTNVYVADYNNRRIRKIVIATGAVSTFAGSGTGGGSDATGTSATFSQPWGMAYDGAGNLYVSDPGGQTIRKIVVATAAVTTVAGSYGTYGSADGLGSAARFYQPGGLCCDASGTLYIGEMQNSMIRKMTFTKFTYAQLPAGLSFDYATGTISGTPTVPSAATNYPVMASNGSGTSTFNLNIKVNDLVPVISYTATPQVYTINTPITPITATSTGGTTSGRVVTTYAGSTTSGSTNATGTAARFNYPYGICSDGTNFYVADMGNHAIRKIVIATGVVTTLAGGIIGTSDGTGASAQFNGPSDVTTDGAGNLYVVDYNNHKIRKVVIATGVVTTFAGSGSGSYVNGIGPAASFKWPTGICCDGTNLYVADQSNHAIRKIVIATAAVSTLAGTGTAGAVNGIGPAASFNVPTKICYAGGDLFVTEMGNHLIRKVVASTASVSTLAGSGTAGEVDGTGTAAKFNAPMGIVYDGSGILYVTDGSGHTIRKIEIGTAAVSTIAGVAGSSGAVDGLAMAAKFNSPSGIALNGSDLYIADQSNHEIRKLSSGSFTVSPALPAGMDIDPATGTISGTPTATKVATTFTITASNTAGSATATVNLTVNSTMPSLNYSPSTQVYSTNVPITPLTPVVSGGSLSSSIVNVSTYGGLTTSGFVDGALSSAKFSGLQGMCRVGTTLYVADYANNRIRSINMLTGMVSTLAGNGTSGGTDGTGTAASFNTPSDVTTDGKGNLFVTELIGYRVRKIVIATGVVTTLAGTGSAGGTDGTGTAASFNQPNSICCDGTNLYVGCRNNRTIRKIVISTAVVSTLCGSGGSGYTDATGTSAVLTDPWHVCLDGLGNLYFSDGQRIRKVVLATAAVTTLAGNATAASVDGVGTAASFFDPAALMYDGAGSLYVTEYSGRKIRKIDVATATVTTFAGTGTSGYVDGLANVAQFNTPRGICMDGSGNLLVSEYGNNMIRRISFGSCYVAPRLPLGLSLDAATGTISGTPTAVSDATNYTVTAVNGAGSTSSNLNFTVNDVAPAISYTSPKVFNTGAPITPQVPANTGGPVYSAAVSTYAGTIASGSADGTGAAAGFNLPAGICSDGTNFYVTDAGNHLVRKIVIATGAVSTLAGSALLTGFVNATGSAARFSTPSSIATDGAGNLYVVDMGNHSIRKIVIATGVVTTLAGTGAAGSTDATGTSASFNLPNGICYDGGNLYVAEYWGHRVRKIVVATAAVTTLAGTGSTGAVNGTGTSASFNYPQGICADGLGNLYVTEASGAKVRKIVISSAAVTTLAGSGTSGEVDGIGTAASFFIPNGCVYDGNGNLYVSDNAGQTIRKIVVATGAVSTVAGTAGTSGSTDGTAALLKSPASMVLNGGTIYLADGGNNEIRKIALYGYSVSPGLPAGLGLNPGTGVISGTPTALTAAANYTITAKNTGGSSSAVVNIAITNIAPSITYNTPQVYIPGTTITPLQATNTGGDVVGSVTVSTFAGTGTTGSTNGVGTAASFNNPFGVCSDGTNMYIADASNNMIRKIAVATGTVSTFISSGLTTPTDVVTDGQGNLYIANAGGNSILKVVLATGAVSTLAGSGTAGFADGTGTAATFSSPYGLACDGTNLYIADMNNSAIRKIVISTGVVSTLAGTGSTGYADGTGTAAMFYNAKKICLDGAGNLYVSDFYNYRIRKIVLATGVVTTLAGSGTGATTNGIGTAASFNSPNGITCDGAGNLYVAEQSGMTIRKIIIATGDVMTIAGTANSVGTTNGAGTSALFSSPFAIVSDPSGYLYVTTIGTGAHAIRKISVGGYSVSPALPAGLQLNTCTGTISGTPTTLTVATDYTVTAVNANGSSTKAVNITVASMAPAISYSSPQVYPRNTAITALVPTSTGGPVTAGVTVSAYAGNPTAGSADGTGSAAGLSSPAGVCSDATNYYVADAGNHTIRKIVKATGAVTTLAGTAGSSGTTDATGASARFNSPYDVVTDGAGNLYVADKGNYKIRKIVIATGAVTTFAGSGTAGGNNATGTAATFNVPNGISCDGTNLYVSESGNHCVRQIVLSSAAVTTLAGTGLSGSTDGTGTAASFNAPQKLCADGTGNLYVADAGNNRIRKIVLATGVVSTLAGSGTSGNTDGIGAAASFNAPMGIASDGTNLYVSNSNAYTVRKIVVSTGAVSTVAGTSGSAGTFDGSGSAAQFKQPLGLTADAAGNIYVADAGSNEIRKVADYGYMLSAALPVGLSFDVSTGTFSGTPTTPTAATNYTVSARNGAGYSNAVVNITVSDVPPTALSYSTPNVFTKGTAITSLSPSNTGGTIVTYSVSPALPAGLSLDASTGIISGTPTAVAALATYTVTGTNTGGSTTKAVDITVNDVAPTALSYTSPNVYTKGTAITSLSPSNTGGTVVSYSISPALPAGLSLSTTTGVISGTPTAVAAVASYTVTGTNTGGSTTKVVSITVNDVAPSGLSYTTPNEFTKNIAITSLSPTVSGGTVVSYSVSPALPAGLSIDASTGIISGTATGAVAAADYTVTATNSGGSTTSVVRITVVDGFAITFSAPANGTLSVKSGTTDINSGDLIVNGTTLTVTATPNAGYVLSSLKANSVDIVANSVSISAATTIVAVFAKPTWTGATDNDWNNATNWTPNVVPTNLIDIVVDPAANAPLVGTNSVCNNLTVNSGGVITIPAGRSLTVEGTITNSGGAAGIVIKSSPVLPTGTLIYHNAQNAPVEATVEMYSKASWNLGNTTGNKYKWQFFGVPVRTLLTSSVFNGALVRRYDESQLSANWFALTSSSVLSPFTGYEVAQESAKTYTYTGELVNADLVQPLTYTTGAANAGSHLFANPFTAAIDITKLDFGTQTDATVYLFNTGTVNEWANYAGVTDGANPGQYTAAPKAVAGVGGIPGQVPSMQGFVVKALSSSANATFGIPYSAVVIKNVDMQRAPSDFLSASASAMVYSIVDVIGANGGDRMWMFTDASCSHKFDNGWDGKKMLGSALVPQLYAKESDGDYQVNSVNDVNNTELAFQAGTDSQYKLRFTHSNTQTLYDKLYLYDNVTGTTTDITQSGTEYSFTASAGSTAATRFKVISSTSVTTGVSVGTNDEKLVIFSSKNTIFVKNNTADKGDLQLYDVMGRYLQKIPFGAGTITSIPMSLVPGVYVAKAIINNRTMLTKNLIIK